MNTIARLQRYSGARSSAPEIGFPVRSAKLKRKHARPMRILRTRQRSHSRGKEGAHPTSSTLVAKTVSIGAVIERTACG